MNVLIINLTRFGDLIQTQPVITGYANQGHRVGLVCLENFASAVALLNGVDVFFPFSGAGVLAKLDEDWRVAVREVVEFKTDIFSSFTPDRVINLTPSVSSRLLAFDLTPSGAQAVGFTVDVFGFNADTSMWAAYLQMAGSNRCASPFNVCDIFRRTAELGDEGNTLCLSKPSPSVLMKAKEILCESDTDHEGKYLALQMGASEERRRWPVQYFVQCAEKAWQGDGLVPVLLGTKNEIELGVRFLERANFPVVNLIGKTSLLELAGVLSTCKALITNDTGTMHLAAGLNVPLCGVFLATAQPWDTGPYRAGNICLEPDMDCHPCGFGQACPREHICRKSVTPDTMYKALQSALGNNVLEAFTGARVWRTHVDSSGFMNLESLSGHDKTDHGAWIGIQRVYYRAFLDGTVYKGLTGLARHMKPAMRESLSKTLTDARDMLFLLSQQGLLLVRNPRQQAKSKFLTSWQRLQSVLSGNEHLNILGLLWMFETQQRGTDLVALLDMTERYRVLVTSLLSELE